MTVIRACLLNYASDRVAALGTKPRQAIDDVIKEVLTNPWRTTEVTPVQARDFWNACSIHERVALIEDIEKRAARLKSSF